MQPILRSELHSLYSDNCIPAETGVGARELVLMAPGLVYVERLIPIDMCAAVTNPQFMANRNKCVGFFFCCCFVCFVFFPSAALRQRIILRPAKSINKAKVCEKKL